MAQWNHGCPTNWDTTLPILGCPKRDLVRTPAPLPPTPLYSNTVGIIVRVVAAARHSPSVRSSLAKCIDRTSTSRPPSTPIHPHPPTHPPTPTPQKAPAITNKHERKRLAKKRRLEEEAAAAGTTGGGGGNGGKQQQQQQQGNPNKKAKPKMTYEERRAKFLRPKQSEWGSHYHQNANRPGSHKRKATKVYCFGCRQPGHMLQDCPEKAGTAGTGAAKGGAGAGNGKRICFNCGSIQHRLAHCPKPRVNGTWWWWAVEVGGWVGVHPY